MGKARHRETPCQPQCQGTRDLAFDAWKGPGCQDGKPLDPSHFFPPAAGPQAGPPCLRGELGPVFMQLWGGHSLAGSAACSVPALTQQSTPAHTQTHTRGGNTHVGAQTNGHTRTQVYTHRHSHSQTHLWPYEYAHTNTQTQRNTHTVHQPVQVGRY